MSPAQKRKLKSLVRKVHDHVTELLHFERRSNNAKSADAEAHFEQRSLDHELAMRDALFKIDELVETL